MSERHPVHILDPGNLILCLDADSLYPTTDQEYMLISKREFLFDALFNMRFPDFGTD